MCSDEKKLAELIDECVKSGSMHINVRTGNATEIENSRACCIEGGACSSPTINNSLDVEE